MTKPKKLRWNGSNRAQQRYEQAVSMLPSKVKRKKPPRKRRPLVGMSYDEYINTPEWMQKRRKKLRSVGYRCEVCGKGGRLQVHHKTYARLGREPLTDLQALCGDCHSVTHENDDVAKGRANDRCMAADPLSREFRQMFQ